MEVCSHTITSALLIVLEGLWVGKLLIELSLKLRLLEIDVAAQARTFVYRFSVFLPFLPSNRVSISLLTHSIPFTLEANDSRFSSFYMRSWYNQLDSMLYKCIPGAERRFLFCDWSFAFILLITELLTSDWAFVSWARGFNFRFWWICEAFFSRMSPRMGSQPPMAVVTRVRTN